MQRAIWVLWPSFIVGGIANAMFFTFVDPLDLRLFGTLLSVSRIGVYTLGFFAFWLVAGTSSAFTCFLQRTAADVNNKYVRINPDTVDRC